MFSWVYTTTQTHTHTKTHTVTNTSIEAYLQNSVSVIVFFSKIDCVRLRQNPYFIVVWVELGICCCSASSYVQKWNSNISIQQFRSHGQRANVCRNFIQKVAVLKENALSLWDSIRKIFFSQTLTNTPRYLNMECQSSAKHVCKEKKRNERHTHTQ